MFEPFASTERAAKPEYSQSRRAKRELRNQIDESMTNARMTNTARSCQFFVIGHSGFIRYSGFGFRAWGNDLACRQASICYHLVTFETETVGSRLEGAFGSTPPIDDGSPGGEGADHR